MGIHYPLVVSTLFQRLGLGLYIVSIFAVSFLGINLPLNIIAAVTLVLFGSGLLISLTHLGRPKRIMNSFSNLKSHLTQEGLIAPFVGLFVFIQAIDGFVFRLSPSFLNIVEIFAVIFSLAFLVSTGLVYQLFARPGWNTRLVSVMFLASTAILGASSTYAFAAVKGVQKLDTLFLIVIVTQAIMVFTQILYLNHISKVGYGVSIKYNNNEIINLIRAWAVAGVLLPVTLIVLTYMNIWNTSAVAVILFLSNAGALFIWRMFFFKVAKQVKFFPQYELDLTTNF